MTHDATLEPAGAFALAPLAALADGLGCKLLLLDGERVVWSNAGKEQSCHELVCNGSCHARCILVDALESGSAELTLSIGDETVLRRIAAKPWLDGLTLVQYLDIPLPGRSTDFRRLFEYSPVMLQSNDRAGYLLDVNRKWLEVMGYAREEVVGRRIDSLMTPETAQHLMQQLIPRLRREGSIENVRGQFVRADGSVIEVEANAVTIEGEDGRPLNLTVFTDITERRRAEELEAQLRQAQKMEAVGQMAGGLAHEFNNLLTAIIGNLSLMELEGPGSPDYAQYFRDVSDAAQRSSELTRQLLLFSRKTAGNFTSVDAGEVVHQAAKLVRHGLPPGIELHLHIEPDCPPVQGDATLLHQVLMNLVLNARDACAEGGTITLTARPREYHGKPSPPARPGCFVEIEVRDSGAGMAPEVRQRIFEPFFTTKGAAQGTGLGLAVVYSIVQQHAGWITVDSTVGEGATFRIYLPASAQQADPPMSHAEVPRGRGQSVLVVEDDDLVLQLLRSTLTRHGYTVDAFDTAEDARAALREHGCDVLISDVQLPGEDGFSLLRWALDAGNANSALAISGNTIDGQASEKLSGLSERARFLPKPFRAADLLLAVAALLEA